MPLINLETTFGKVRISPLQWNPLIFIRHGLGSTHKPFVNLEKYLRANFVNAVVNNKSYDWRDSILLNGARLADEILQAKSDRPLVLIGHSMGGLLCRVANVILCDLAGFRYHAANLAPHLTYRQDDLRAIAALPFGQGIMPVPKLLVTLATPNSGGILQGQISGISYILKTASNLFPSTNLESVADLTSSRLFRFLQNFAVNTPTLSISGSQGNRFARGSGQITSWLGKIGLRIEMPNDLIVEDRSVDLQNSILPNEIVHHGKSPYKHARCYIDCTDVRHTNIYDDLNVLAVLLDCLKRC
jgi:pimeloyl-ACP methyl ester carboxylesterase